MSSFFLSQRVREPGLIESWDVLKYRFSGYPCAQIMINRNMRCIEMQNSGRWFPPLLWLIETWDVLKWKNTAINIQELRINRNMRCIEIINMRVDTQWRYLINRNMRCIEMEQEILWLHRMNRLIETWDVLKWPCNLWKGCQGTLINRNMRCIEI